MVMECLYLFLAECRGLWTDTSILNCGYEAHLHVILFFFGHTDASFVGISQNSLRTKD